MVRVFSNYRIDKDCPFGHLMGCMADLFSTFTLKSAHLRNRIAIPPMCQYMAEDGVANDWHRTHYSALARGGAGLVIVEATAVAPEGRITPKCTGIWNDAQAGVLSEIATSIKAAGAVAGIQLAHAGRKASANIPWEGDDHIPEGNPNGWQTIAPSAKAFGAGLPKIPREMTLADIERVKNDFVAAARRAVAAGFEWIELHFAHGYLAQSFFSKHSNLRTDQYGGSYENRARFPKEIVAAVKQVIPADMPLTARFGVLEFDQHDEETLRESIQLIREWRALGVDMVSVSIGFTIPDATIPWGPAFMAPIAARIRREAGIPVSSAWGFGAPELADAAVRNEQLDLVMVARAHLENPNWPYFAARQIKKARPDWVLPAPYAHWLERYHRPTAA
jgi:2,4-dienoyl-CoA reductase-like NADH-dependent reductase (Old Yellow Enzyme family)